MKAYISNFASNYNNDPNDAKHPNDANDPNDPNDANDTNDAVVRAYFLSEYSTRWVSNVTGLNICTRDLTLVP